VVVQHTDSEETFQSVSANAEDGGSLLAGEEFGLVSGPQVRNAVLVSEVLDAVDGP